MGLPSFDLPTGVVPVGGQDVKVRGLSRGEVLKLRPLLESVTDGGESSEDIRALEVRLLSHGFDVPEAEAGDWYDLTATAVIGPCVEKVMELSGLTEDAARPTNED